MAIWRPSGPSAVGIALDSSATRTPILPRPSRHRVVHVGRDHALRDLELGDAAQGHVLADGGDELLHAILDGGLRAREVSGLERLDACRRPSRAILAASRDEGLELLVAGDEVGLGVDLEDRRRVAATTHRDQALGGDAAGLLGGLERPFLRSQSMAASISPLVSVERGLAVHHAGAGLSRAAPSPSQR